MPEGKNRSSYSEKSWDLIAEADMSGLINAHVISNGRHGRTREITLSLPAQILGKAKEILHENLNL